MSRPDLAVINAEYKGERVDLLAAQGRIIELVPAGSGGGGYGDAAVVDAQGLTLLPSLTDAHVHLREPGFEHKEDIQSGLRAAAFGGFSNVLAMANTRPVNDSPEVTALMLARARQTWPHGPRLFPVGGLTLGLQGRELADLARLAEAGCAAFSNDGLPVADSEIFRRGMVEAARLGIPLIDHCEDPFMAVGAGLNEGAVSRRLGLTGQPDVSEALQVARDVMLAEYLDAPIHLAHISCRRSVEIIAQARKRGVRVTAETCPHYLLLTEDEVEASSTAAKVNPPLRTRDDVEAMRQALREGVVDILVTDHAPHSASEKAAEFSKAPCGVSGLDTALSLTWELVETGVLPLEDFLRAWTTGPAAIFKTPVNAFSAGDPADFFLFDVSVNWELTPNMMQSKGKNTPFMGRTLRGRVMAHFLEGKKIV